MSVLASTDPFFFAVNWDQLGEALALLVVLSFVVERALSPLFEAKWFIGKPIDRFKEAIAVGLALLVGWYLDFDLLAILAHREVTGWLGLIVTAAVVAGGSKASIKLFRDVLGFQSSAFKEERRNQALAATDVARSRADTIQDPDARVAAHAKVDEQVASIIATIPTGAKPSPPPEGKKP